MNEHLHMCVHAYTSGHFLARVSMFLLSLAGVDDAGYSLGPSQENGKSPGIIPSHGRRVRGGGGALREAPPDG